MLCLLCLSFSTLFAADEVLSTYEVIEDKAGLTIETPALAKREMRKLRLENGLEALLISDPETHESGAALAVAVGSWDDPEERPGMAHFVEHLLFLGTEKYPIEEEYSRYLDEHGGLRNAYTMADRTVYIFSVNNDGFLGALDRFGQFFISPLFNPSGVERECKAIHQEYSKNLPSDAWRLFYVKKELGNENHPFHSFCIGNSDTLKKISQDELKEWYRAHYSANLMHLVIYSSLDLDTLEKETVSLFSAVSNQEKKPSRFSEPLLKAGESPKLCAITPVQEIQQLELCWEIPRFYGQDRLIHADRLLSHVLGHEGATSLLAQLKRENLGEALSVGTFRAGNDQCLLSLSIDLTTKGVQEYEKVITRCFEAIASLRQSGIPLYLFDEVCQIENMRYKFQSKQEIFEFVSDYAAKLIDEPLDTFPYQTLIPSQYAPEKIQELIATLSPETCQYTLMAPPALTKLKATAKEKWMGVGYTLVDISPAKLREWTQSDYHTAISIPRPNPFLPSALAIKGAVQRVNHLLPQPELICDEPIGKIYAAEDTQFLVPEVSWTFSFKTPLISDADPLSHVYGDLYCHTVNERLKNTSYEALVGGLSYSLTPVHGALELKIVGFSDKAADFLKQVLIAMKNASPRAEEFALYRELMGRDYTNALTASPIKEAKELLLGILFKEFSGMEQKNKVLKKASYEQMTAFCKNVLKECYVEGLLYGNASTEDSRQAWELVKQILPIETPYPLARHPKIEIANLPALDHPSFLVTKSDNPANALILTADCGAFTFKRRAAQEILTKGLEEPFFSELRTRQQTAYLVANWSQEIERHLYNFFAIQSASHDTRDLLARFELFIESSLQELSESVIPKERFESIRTAFIKQLEHPADNLSKMGALLHTIAFQYDGDFQWMEKRIEAFKELTYEEFLECAQEFLGKGNTRRLAICINGSVGHKGNISYKHITTPEKLRNEICYEARDEQQKALTKGDLHN